MRKLYNKTEKDKKGLEIKIRKKITLGNDTEENIKENNETENKKKKVCNFEQREFPPEFLEGLYANK